jgi:hypothetical protein
MFRRRRPLLRAAAVGGGAYALGSHNRASKEREADQDQQINELQNQAAAPAPAAAPASGGISSDAMEKLQQLAKLHEQGVLTDEEFSAQKEKLLA